MLGWPYPASGRHNVPSTRLGRTQYRREAGPYSLQRRTSSIARLITISQWRPAPLLHIADGESLIVASLRCVCVGESEGACSVALTPLYAS
eukprot:200018-Chlamydomonas_euryale.AAC.1